LPFVPSPIINAQIANRDRKWGLRRFLPYTTQNSVITGRDGQPRQESLAWETATDVADQAHDF
jgi:hypothetical protein